MKHLEEVAWQENGHLYHLHTDFAVGGGGHEGGGRRNRKGERRNVEKERGARNVGGRE